MPQGQPLTSSLVNENVLLPLAFTLLRCLSRYAPPALVVWGLAVDKNFINKINPDNKDVNIISGKYEYKKF